MSNDKLKLKSVSSILSERFFIPAYQRGYRWTESQVNNLLDDIWMFRKESENKNKETFYCLQPIVIRGRGSEWEVIDGQQRLTTIYLILYHLRDGLSIFRKNNFTIRYETRPDSEEFLKEIESQKKEKSIDHYYIFKALQTIVQWFTEKDGSVRINFLQALLNDEETGKNVKFIWYDVSDESADDKIATDIFTRLNIGKIPLTNAELIKALFLSRSPAGGDTERRALKQINIASEWDRIEQTLQQPDFWHFISNHPGRYETRIEYIFDLIKEKKEEYENHYTFYRYYEEFEDKKNDPDALDAIWLNIKRYFLTFEEWFSDRELYHLVGYLVVSGINVASLIDASKNTSKTDFKDWLRKNALNRVDIDELDSLVFDQDKKQIKNTLFLFNVISTLQNTKSNHRFPFHDYHSQKWDIEHVHSQTSKDIAGKDQADWAITLLEYFTGILITDNDDSNIEKSFKSLEKEEKPICENLLAIVKSPNSSNKLFTATYDSLKEFFKESNQFTSADNISNLVLLDAGTNRMYKNAFFPVKRRHIIQKEKQGIFIPPCTKNVFMKAYSEKMGDVMYWNNSDASDYLKEIKRVLSNE